jgi:alkanesulfonate monooxygenase SsuD/methylene tetrahydromethanopterin reductase-like flavin-dependent oxidoreductase (luciferase family)
MQFGAFVPQGWRLDLVDEAPGYPSWQAMVQVAQDLERWQYDSLWLFDHFHTIPDAKLEATFECWVSTAALAQATSTIRLGQLVGCNIYRHPAVLAKMASTIDVISNGRLDFGLGAGYEHETHAYGFAFEKPSVRIGQLDEALDIIIGMWTHDRFQFEGKHYRVGVGESHTFRKEPITLDGVINYPRPVQKPHPPVWVGGGGEQLTLKAVARNADWSNYFFLPLDGVKHKNQVLDDHCAKVGRDPLAVKRSLGLEVFFGDPKQARDINSRRGFTHEELDRRLSGTLTGSAQQMIDTLGKFADEGRIEYVIAYFLDAPRGDSAQRFAEEVVPAFQKAGVGNKS